MTWSSWVDAQLADVVGAGRWRQIRTLDGPGPEFTTADGTRVVSFASNDYLGLSQHPAVIAAGHLALDRHGAGSGSSRLIVGAKPPHDELEEALATWRGTERALLLPTGYAANLAVLTTFGSSARIISDELNHASIIDGARLARSEICVSRHNDVDHVEQLIAEAPGPVVVVSDSVFSMDGDLAPIAELSALCSRTGALLVLDDAHAVFDLVAPDPDAACIRVGTLSKMLGSLGGYVAASGPMIDLLVNRARSFIFTTASSPVDAATATAALAVRISPEGDELVDRLRRNVDRVSPGHSSPIIPVILGDEAVAMAAASELLERGILVPAIRPPTVPVGSSRLRIALSALHTFEQITMLCDGIEAARSTRR